jgi:hypothetical protein
LLRIPCLTHFRLPVDWVFPSDAVMTLRGDCQ